MDADDVSRLPATRKEALAAGFKFFFTGQPCKRDHIAKRQATNNECIVCRDERVKIWYQNNAERARGNRARWREANRESYRASNRRYYRENTEAVLEKSREYYANNREKYSAWKEAWRLTHRDEIHVHTYNSRARARGWTGPNPMSHEDYRSMKAQQQGRCAYCGEEHKLVFEHVVPVAYDGSFAAWNVVMACRRCNMMKGLASIDTFLPVLARRRPGLWTAEPWEIELLLQPRRRMHGL